MIFYNENFQNIKLKDASLNENINTDGTKQFYLSLTYIYQDNKKNIHKIDIPKINFLFENPSIDLLLNNYPKINFGDMNFVMGKNEKGEFLTDKIIKYHCEEMTIEEIQEKLGYKIKIVDKKEKKND